MKPKLAPDITQGSLFEIADTEKGANIQYIDPDKSLYSFKGQANLSGESTRVTDLELKNFIPRGSTLKNSSDVYVMALYTGTDTKMVLNQGKYKFKISHLNYLINRYMLYNLATMIVLQVLLS